MELEDVNPRAVQEAIEFMGPRFQTKDLSESPVMLSAHRLLLEERGYHSCVGRYLSAHQPELGILLVSRDGGPRGARWRKSGAGG